MKKKDNQIMTKVNIIDTNDNSIILIALIDVSHYEADYYDKLLPIPTCLGRFNPLNHFKSSAGIKEQILLQILH